MVGSINDKHGTELVAFRTGERVTLDHLNAYAKPENRVVRKINPSAAALTVFSVIVEGIIFWKFESKVSNDDTNKYLDDFLDIFINGITN